MILLKKCGTVLPPQEDSSVCWTGFAHIAEDSHSVPPPGEAEYLPAFGPGAD